MTTYLCNAFSISMLEPHLVKFVKIRVAKDWQIAKAIKEGTSFMGHKQIAEMYNVPYNRKSLKLKMGDKLFVAQYMGPRLEEGTTEIPENSHVIWFVVYVNDKF